MESSLRFRALSGSSALALACIELVSRMPMLEEPDFVRSIPQLLERPEYGAFLIDQVTFAEDEAQPLSSRVGVGLFCIYEDSFHAKYKLAIEAAWFASDCAEEAQREAWLGLLGVARENKLDGLYLLVDRISPSGPLERLLDTGGWDRYVVRREHHSLFQASTEGIWSAFTGVTQKKAAFVNCIRVQEPVQISLSGIRCLGIPILFRGEGRVGEYPYASCADLRSLVEYVHHHGFTPRAPGKFSGSLVEQILHQGYVASPTVSLTSDPKVACIYATAGGTRSRAAVFAIDTSVKGEHLPVWDSFSSMRKHQTGFLEMDFQSIEKLVRALDVHGAGEVLQGLYAGLSTRAQEYADSLRLQSGPSTYVETSLWNRARAVLTDEELGSLCTVLETTCSHEDRGVAGGAIVATVYGQSFHLALPDLKLALESAGSHVWRHPGWDTTVFGYIAKTCRDREFFSSGAIPAEAIMEARLADASGRVYETIQNPRYAGELGAAAHTSLEG